MKSHKNTLSIDSIESVLAQTQCRLCEYEDCRAYATAIAQNQEQIDRCLPGGEKTLYALAKLTQQDPEPYLKHINNHTKPIKLAIVREEECIGCTKCLQACPVDAIIGSSKQMHTVIADACNGCELCIPPCPVDCIDTAAHPQYQSPHELADSSKQRYQRKQQREQQRKTKETFKKNSLDARKAMIQAALERVKTRDSS